MTRTIALILVPCLALACSGKGKKDGDTDADATDTTEVPDGMDVLPDGEDAPDVPTDVEEDSELPPGPSHVLKYLGHYEHQDDGPDHLMGSALLDAGPLVVASATGVAAVDPSAVEAGTVTSHMGKYLIDRSTASNLDGAPSGSHFFPKFFNVETLGTTAYVSTRFDGLYIFDVTGSGSSWTVSEVRRIVRSREFTEGVHVVGDNLFVTHHADGIEVMDLSSDPQDPTTIDTLGDPLVDAWGVWAMPDGKVWVADGAGGVKYVRLESGSLSHITGDTVTTAPGTALDVTVVDTWVVAAMAGQGIGVYEEWTAAHRINFELPGVCVDVEPMGTDRVAVACRSWVHVVEISELGLPTVLASARLHRRLYGTSVSVHIGSNVTVDGAKVYVAGWDHLDAFELLEADTDPDVQLSGQRAHFGDSNSTAYFHVWNAGQGTLEISDVECTDSGITCPIDDTTIPPGGRTNLRIISDGSASNLQTLVRVVSNDPDEPTVPILTFVDLDTALDPEETAPDFTASTTLRDYSSSTFTDSSVTLYDHSTAGEVVHFAVFGFW